MTDEQPLDLASLGDVDSPETVSVALRRFRRRIFSTGAVVLLAAVSLLGGISWAVITNRTLEERIEEAPGTNVGAVFERDGATVLLTRIAEVDTSLGLSFVVARASDTGEELFVRIAGARELDTGGGGGIHEIHLLVPPTEDGLVGATLMEQRGCLAELGGSCESPGEPVGRFTIDLGALGVPPEIWKEGNDDD